MVIFGVKWIFLFRQQSCDLKFKVIGIWVFCSVRPFGYDCSYSTGGCWSQPNLVRVPDVAYVSVQQFFLPPCRMSTQWLGSSKWLARGGRRSRCVQFCPMHSQCLPKTVQRTAAYTAAHCITLQHTDILQHAAPHCNTLYPTATQCSTLQHTATHCDTLQHTATHCNTLQHTATHCNTLQHTATHCNTLQHIVEMQHTATQCDTQLSSRQVCCSVCCSVLQYISVCCSIVCGKNTLPYLPAALRTMRLFAVVQGTLEIQESPRFRAGRGGKRTHAAGYCVSNTKRNIGLNAAV